MVLRGSCGRNIDLLRKHSDMLRILEGIHLTGLDLWLYVWRFNQSVVKDFCHIWQSFISQSSHDSPLYDKPIIVYSDDRLFIVITLKRASNRIRAIDTAHKGPSRWYK